MLGIRGSYQITDCELDTSVTQSAMEEAYLSTMQAGGVASRMSSLSQAVRSRYFPSN